MSIQSMCICTGCECLLRDDEIEMCAECQGHPRSLCAAPHEMPEAPMMDDFCVYADNPCGIGGTSQPSPAAPVARLGGKADITKVSVECLADLLISRLEALAKGHIEQSEFVKAYAETCLVYAKELQRRQGQ